MTIEEMLIAKEGENFEFKTAENRFSYTELQKYASAISNAKPWPDFEGTTDSRVRLTLGAVIVDESIIRLLKAIGEKTLASFATEDFIAVRSVLMGDK